MDCIQLHIINTESGRVQCAEKKTLRLPIFMGIDNNTTPYIVVNRTSRTMDFFQHRYYRLNEFLLKVTGLWPYQSVQVRLVINVAANSLTVSVLIPHVTAIVKRLDDRDFLVECALPTIFICIWLTKYFTWLFNAQKMSKLLNHMRMDWKVCGQDCDVNILHEYAERGRRMTILYTVMLITTSIVFLNQPVVPKIIDFLLKNGTEPGQFPIPVDYIYIDMQQYYFYIVVHSSAAAFFATLVSNASDSIFMVYVQHGCGLFAILRYKLERLGTTLISGDFKDITYGLDNSLIMVNYLGSRIDEHNRAIKYAELIDATFSWCFFFVVAFNMILISIEGVQIIERTNELEITIKLICCIAMAMIHLYIESYMGQILMDHSISIRDSIINGKWYVLPLKAQKLLPMILMRCDIPCKLTVAKMGTMSMETFCVILKTSLSYFTLLRSM